MERIRCEGARYEPRTSSEEDGRDKVAVPTRTGPKPVERADAKAPLGPPPPPDSPGKDALIKQRAAGKRKVPAALPPKPKPTAEPTETVHVGRVDHGPNGTTERGVLRTRTGGGQLELEATGARSKTKDGTQADVAGVRVHVGVRNPDGSVGINVGASATAASVEKKVEMGSTTVGVGVSESIGASASAGLRDKDGDGVPEFCQSVSALWFSGTICMEGVVGPAAKKIAGAIRD